MANPEHLPHSYYNGTLTLAMLDVDVEVNLQTLLDVAARGPRDKTRQPGCHYIVLDTDTTVTFKVNLTTADAITLTTSGLTIPVDAMAIMKLYFTRGVVSSASGNAIVSIFAV